MGEESKRRQPLDRIADITSRSALFLSTVARFRTDAAEEGDPLHSAYRWFRRIYGGSGPGPRHRGSGDVQQLTVPRANILFFHRGTEGRAPLTYDDEPTGTHQLLDLATEATAVLRTGGLMVVDEIDASLHPVLTASLTRIFQGPDTNPWKSQLIFTTHDATLLGTFDAEEILKRDQVWFTEKDEDGASSLYPLSDFKPRRQGENRSRRYLNGNYGAVPDLSADIFEQAVLSRGEPRS